MRKILALITVFLALTFISVLGHIAFYFANYSLITGEGNASLLQMLWHGLRLDFSVSGYASLIPGIILIISIWWKKKALVSIWRTYFVIVSFAFALAILANIALYGFWGFPLDSTPLFYLLTSPADATASVSTMYLALAFFILICLTFLLYKFIDTVVHTRRVLLGKKRRYYSHSYQRTPVKTKVTASIVLALFTAMLIIPIRGGVTVATNNVGSVYFSNNYRLNHAAVNPVFSFLYSVMHDEDFSSKYRYMDDKEAASLFNEMVYTKMRTTSAADSSMQTVSLSPAFMKAMEKGRNNGKEGVNVVIVILESFSSYIMNEAGNVKGVTSNLEALANEGVYFTNFYANSFRTDRGLMSILSGYPAQPTASLMKYPHKTNNLYSISRSLGYNGFNTHYIYGGDANFTNMRSYLRATGFDNIIAEEDFDSNIERGKWGVNDESLFARAIAEMPKGNTSGNNLYVVQTSSSHEPYEVPVKKFEDKALNAFYYTDMCLGNYIAELKKNNKWSNTLMLVVPDHLGCYPAKQENFKLWRYQIPLILAGGAITQPERVKTIGSQQDIPATLLALLGMEHSEFTFSKDLLDAKAPHFAFFTVPDAVGLVTEEEQVIYDNESKKAVLQQGANSDKAIKRAQAYLQKLYDDIAKLSE